MQLRSNGSVPRSAAQGGELTARYRQSGPESRDFCAADGLVARPFAEWGRRGRRKEGAKGQFVECSSPPKVSGLGAVEFPPGVRLRVRG